MGEYDTVSLTYAAIIAALVVHAMLLKLSPGFGVAIV